MTCFPLAAACNRADAAFQDRFEALRAAVLDTYRAHDLRPSERLDIECALFILWSVEIGLLNARTWWMDRRWAERRFTGLIRHHLAFTAVTTIAAGMTMPHLYRHRFRDVLRTIRNIYAVPDGLGRLQVPLTERATKLFLRYTTDVGHPPSPCAHRQLHNLLMKECQTYILAMLSARPTGSRPAGRITNVASQW